MSTRNQDQDAVVDNSCLSRQSSIKDACDYSNDIAELRREIAEARGLAATIGPCQAKTDLERYAADLELQVCQLLAQRASLTCGMAAGEFCRDETEIHHDSGVKEKWLPD